MRVAIGEIEDKVPSPHDEGKTRLRHYPRTGNPERPRRCVYRKLKPARNGDEVRQGWGASWCADVRRFLRPINTD